MIFNIFPFEIDCPHWNETGIMALSHIGSLLFRELRERTQVRVRSRGSDAFPIDTNHSNIPLFFCSHSKNRVSLLYLNIHPIPTNQWVENNKTRNVNYRNKKISFGNEPVCSLRYVGTDGKSKCVSKNYFKG